MSTREQEKRHENRQQKREARQLGTSVGGATADHRGLVLVLVESDHTGIDHVDGLARLLCYYERETAATDAVDEEQHSTGNVRYTEESIQIL
mmetsp:Transcript_26268/g.47657  ORF Transcript_26268/g.47657 Transcript_26268/m.47657 type:complete len:92 (-) Transcript_26268:74-349(-)